MIDGERVVVGQLPRRRRRRRRSGSPGRRPRGASTARRCARRGHRTRRRAERVGRQRDRRGRRRRRRWSPRRDAVVGADVRRRRAPTSSAPGARSSAAAPSSAWPRRSPVHAPTTTVAPRARNVRRDSRMRGSLAAPGRGRVIRVPSRCVGRRSEIERVGVVGGGLMGSGIAEVCARAGLDVVVREVDAGGGRGRPGADDRARSTAACARASSPRPTATPPSAG